MCIVIVIIHKLSSALVTPVGLKIYIVILITKSTHYFGEIPKCSRLYMERGIPTPGAMIPLT